MDSEDPASLDPLSMPLCGNHVNRLTQEYATPFFPASMLADPEYFINLSCEFQLNVSGLLTYQISFAIWR